MLPLLDSHQHIEGTLMSQPLDSRQPSSCYQVLAISELARLICDFSYKRTWVNLLYVSHRTFASIAPIVWEDVDLKSVFLLIPEVELAVNKVNKSGHEALECFFSFPEIVDLTRFKVYADFVKVVKTHVPYVLESPHRELGYELPEPLLPNLQRLVIKTYGPADIAACEWVPSLLTPCLLQLEFQSTYLEESGGEDMDCEHSWMRPEDCFELIDRISHKCPHLDTLRIFPGVSDRPNTTVSSPKYDGITSLKHLHMLALGTPDIDQELFLSLAQLPHLETLSLHADNSQPKQIKSDPITIPEDSFLALRHLGLYGLSESSIQRICTISPLFRHLVKASIVASDLSLETISEQRNFSSLITQCLGQNSPDLVDLTVFSPRRSSCLALYFPAVLDVFRHMSLRRLRIDMVRFKSWGNIDPFDDSDSDFDEEIGQVEIQWRDFLVTVPHLEELHLDLEVVFSPQLPIFASTLPNLRLLVLMGLVFVGGEDLVSPAAKQPITIRCPYCVGDTGDWADASKLASIWPNAQFEVKKSMSWMYDKEPLDESEELAARFNEALELLRSNSS
ncbi:hypothetical protein FRC10_010997 [Ceratobasidium sp. 414]|nr:hypothetical protein FRC10_010997 [Ceratobasidium sp. 414]